MLMPSLRPNIAILLATATLAILLMTTLIRADDPPAAATRDLAQLQRCKVGTIDGIERIELQIGGRETPIRLAYLSEPVDDDAAHAASEYLSRLLESEAVYVELIKPREATDRKDAVSDALIFRVPDGLFVNVEMVRLGFARPRSGIDGEDGKLMRFYEQRARQAKKGIWAPPTKLVEDRKPEPGRDERGASSGEEAGIVYVTASGKKYHRKDCQYLTATAKAIALAEARKTHEPCSRCKPPK